MHGKTQTLLHIKLEKVRGAQKMFIWLTWNEKKWGLWVFWRVTGWRMPRHWEDIFRSFVREKQNFNICDTS